MAAKNKVLVALSGGVDSSVTAAILKKQGYDLFGVYFKLWSAGEYQKNTAVSGCLWADEKDARQVCDILGIPLYTCDLTQTFKQEVVDYYIHEYLQCKVPNPCVVCTIKIKFNTLIQKAHELGCDFISTGHYAQVVADHSTGLMRLLKASDQKRDQSYYLYGLSQDVLKRTMMPLGNLTKTRVRKLAQEFGLKNIQREDSPDICFVTDQDSRSLIESHVAPALRAKGMIRSIEGNIMTSHEGLYQYAIGQTRGLNINAENGAPYYVIGFDIAANELIVGTEKHLYSKTLRASQVSWIRQLDKLKTIKCKAKINAQYPESDCRVVIYDNDTVTVEFEEPQKSITPGQSVVFYDHVEVLGGGIIDSSKPHEEFKISHQNSRV